MNIGINCLKKNIGFCGNNNHKPKVSVILPVYNKEKDIHKAINSLKEQTMSDLEIICVNDGSTDNSLSILDNYAKDDSRIKVINQNNQNCGGARNTGVKAATGEYLSFLDPDDYLNSNALETLYNKAKKQNCDIVIFDYNFVNEAGEKIKKKNVKEKLEGVIDLTPERIFTWSDIKVRLFKGLYATSTNKLYNSEFVKKNKMRFAKSNFADDSPFIIDGLLSAKRMSYIEKPFYNYVIYNGSASRTVSDKNFSIFRSFKAIQNVLVKHGLREELTKEFDAYILHRVCTDIRLIKSKNKFLQECMKKLSYNQTLMLKEHPLKISKLLSILSSLTGK